MHRFDTFARHRVSFSIQKVMSRRILLMVLGWTLQGKEVWIKNTRQLEIQRLPGMNDAKIGIYFESCKYFGEYLKSEPFSYGKQAKDT